MLRVGARGEGKFKRISLDLAFDFLAGRLKEIKQKHGPESVALFPHGVASTFFLTLMRGYGTHNIAEPAFAQCPGPREVGYALTFGQGLGSPEPVDLEEAKMIVLIGTHIGENVFTSQVTEFAEGLARSKTDRRRSALFNAGREGQLVATRVARSQTANCKRMH